MTDDIEFLGPHFEPPHAGRQNLSRKLDEVSRAERRDTWILRCASVALIFAVVISAEIEPRIHRADFSESERILSRDDGHGHELSEAPILAEGESVPVQGTVAGVRMYWILRTDRIE